LWVNFDLSTGSESRQAVAADHAWHERHACRTTSASRRFV
jgi:hypothetical protein